MPWSLRTRTHQRVRLGQHTLRNEPSYLRGEWSHLEPHSAEANCTSRPSAQVTNHQLTKKRRLSPGASSFSALTLLPPMNSAEKSLLSCKKRCFVYVCVYIFRNCCLSSSYSVLFSTEYRKSSLRNWTQPCLPYCKEFAAVLHAAVTVALKASCRCLSCSVEYCSRN